MKVRRVLRYKGDLDPIDAFRELGRISLGETDLQGFLTRVAALAKHAVPGASEVSVTLVRGTAAHTVASTGDYARAIDEWQYTYGRGPCLDASAQRDTISIPDVRAETRWPGWDEHAALLGVGSAFSVGLPIRDAVSGAINLYATTARAFDDEAMALAGSFAEYAAVALANADLYDATVTVARQLQTAMESRAMIEQAKGIIMSQRRCGPDEAFAILSRASQDANRKLREVAADLVERTQHR